MPDVIAASAVCRVEDGPLYRGYPLSELAQLCCFEEVAYLLIHGELPTGSQLDDFTARVATARRLPEPVLNLFEWLPSWTPPLDALRTAISALGHFDQDYADDSPEANRRKSERLVAQLPVAVADFLRSSRRQQPIAARRDLSHSSNVLYMARGREPSPAEARALDVAMIVAAEYEFNPSAYAARVIASTGSDLYAAVTGAVGALRGARAGAASAAVLAELKQASNAATVEVWALEAFQSGPVAGFGKPIDISGDARPQILKNCLRDLSATASPAARELEEVAEQIETVAAREHGLRPTIVWPAARLYAMLGFDWGLYPALFAVARVAGWCAHVIEQSESSEAIRPRADYTGPVERSVVPLAERV